MKTKEKRQHLIIFFKILTSNKINIPFKVSNIDHCLDLLKTEICSLSHEVWSKGRPVSFSLVMVYSKRCSHPLKVPPHDCHHSGTPDQTAV